MAFLKALENTPITLPLDSVLAALRAVRGEPMSAETTALLKVEVASALCSVPGVEDEVIEAVMRETFGDWREL